MKKLFCFLLICAAAMPACKKLQEKVAENAIQKTIERQTGAETTVDAASRSIKIRAKEGQLTFTAGEAKFPVDFPSDIFVDKESKVDMSLKSNSGDSLVFDSSKSVSENLELYKIKMKENGWSSGQESAAGGIGSITFKKKNRTVSLMFFSSGSRTKINLMIQSSS